MFSFQLISYKSEGKSPQRGSVRAWLWAACVCVGCVRAHVRAVKFCSCERKCMLFVVNTHYKRYFELFCRCTPDMELHLDIPTHDWLPIWWRTDTPCSLENRPLCKNIYIWKSTPFVKRNISLCSGSTLSWKSSGVFFQRCACNAS